VSAELIQVIRTDMEGRGKGVEGDPYRRIVQYWSTDGKLLAEVDPCQRGGRIVAGDTEGET
jgi:hypothetical protein